MKILILYFLEERNKKQLEILKNLEKSVTANGHTVTICNEKDATNLHFAMFDYVTVLISANGGFSTEIPAKMQEILKTHGSLASKKGAALVIKKGFSTNKMSRKLMWIMEKEGMFIDYFDIIDSPGFALHVGKKLG